MRGVPFTACKLRLSDPAEAPPPDGAFLRTDAGSVYRLERVVGRTLHCTRWPPAEVPGDALVVRWFWTGRG